MAISSCCYVAGKAIRICARGVGFLVQNLKANSLGSYLVGRILIVRQYLRQVALLVLYTTWWRESASRP